MGIDVKYADCCFWRTLLDVLTILETKLGFGKCFIPTRLKFEAAMIDDDVCIDSSLSEKVSLHLSDDSEDSVEERRRRRRFFDLLCFRLRLRERLLLELDLSPLSEAGGL